MLARRTCVRFSSRNSPEQRYKESQQRGEGESISWHSPSATRVQLSILDTKIVSKSEWTVTPAPQFERTMVFASRALRFIRSSYVHSSRRQISDFAMYVISVLPASRI